MTSSQMHFKYQGGTKEYLNKSRLKSKILSNSPDRKWEFVHAVDSSSTGPESVNSLLQGWKRYQTRIGLELVDRIFYR
jgi:hypothetical protein